MLMSPVMTIAAVIAFVAWAGIPFVLFGKPKLTPMILRLLSVSLLVTAALVSALMTMIALAAAAFGMDTSVPFGLGVYPFLVPALSCPAFLLLRFNSVRDVVITFWALTIACGLAWYLGENPGRVAAGLKPITDSGQRLGTFFNAFTLLYISIAAIVQAAAFYHSRGRVQTSSYNDV